MRLHPRKHEFHIFGSNLNDHYDYEHKSHDYANSLYAKCLAEKALENCIIF